jgi:RNA polymerase sigma-70 factor (ECF subfamily)
LENKTDKQLVAMCKRGNHAAFDELIRRSEPYFKSWILKYCKGNDSLGEEIYSQTLVKSWQKIKTFKGDCAFKTWFCSIANRNFLDEYRKSQRVKFIDLGCCVNLDTQNSDEQEGKAFPVRVRAEFDIFDENLPHSPIEKRERFKKVQSTLDKIFRKLKPKYREVLRLHYRDGLEYKDIAKRLNIPVGTVMSRLFYGRKRARLIIERLNYKL